MLFCLSHLFEAVLKSPKRHNYCHGWHRFCCYRVFCINANKVICYNTNILANSVQMNSELKLLWLSRSLIRTRTMNYLRFPPTTCLLFSWTDHYQLTSMTTLQNQTPHLVPKILSFHFTVSHCLFLSFRTGLMSWHETVSKTYYGLVPQFCLIIYPVSVNSSGHWLQHYLSILSTLRRVESLWSYM